MSQQPINYNELTEYLKGTNEAQETADNLVKTLAPYLKERDKTKLLRILDVGCSDGTFTFLYARQLRKLAPRIHLTAIEPEIPAYKKFVQRVKDENYDWVSYENIRIQEFLKRGGGEQYDLILFSQCWYHFPKDEWDFILDGAIKHLAEDGLIIIILDSHDCEAYKLKDRITGGKPDTLEFGDLHSAEDIEKLLKERNIEYGETSFPIYIFVKDDEQKFSRLARYLAFLYRTTAERILNDYQEDLETMIAESKKSGSHYTIENRVKIITFKKPGSN